MPDHRTRARITFDFDFDTAKARNRFPDIEMSGEPPLDGIEVYVDALAQESLGYLRGIIDGQIDLSPIHWISQLNPYDAPRAPIYDGDEF